MTTAKARAEDALMERLEEWAATLGSRGATCLDGTKYFPSRQMTGFRRAHDAGVLLGEITGWLDDYVFRPSTATERMERSTREVTEGPPIWEIILAEQNQLWSSYVTSHQRAVLNGLIASVNRNVASGQRLRAQLAAQPAKRAASTKAPG